MRPPMIGIGKVARAAVFAVGLALVGLLVTALLPGCPSTYKAWWVGANTGAKAMIETDKAIAAAFESRKNACMKNSADRAAFVACVEKSKEYEALAAWVLKVKPAVASALDTLSAALLMSEKIGDDSEAAKKQWATHLRAALCTVATVVKNFGHLFPESAKTVLGYVEAVKVVTCK